MSKTMTVDDSLDLCVVVEQLVEQTRLLRIVIDELRGEIEWRNRNVVHGDALHGIVRVVSVPRDPAGDWSGQVNAVPEETFEELRRMEVHESDFGAQPVDGDRQQDSLTTRQQALW